jgi:23S rRNA (cytosine1962-C5)-methyltransferase
MELAAGNLRHNGFDTDRVEQVEANVFEQLRTWRRGERRFDIIVLDPPKLIDSKQTEARGARAYKDVNMQAFALLRPGGLLITFSCSGLLSPQLMQKIVADAALDAGRQGRIIQRLGQSADHPVALNFPEADYLKGLCIQVD